MPRIAKFSSTNHHTQTTRSYRTKNILYARWNTEKSLFPIWYAETKVKQEIKSWFQAFLSNYDTGIATITMADACTGRYNTIDNISFANNFPTALTISTRYRESHCGYYLPANGDGPFQIIAKDYGTGQITLEIFTQSIQDFIDFAKNKINRYEKANKADIKPEFKINLSIHDMI